jgi:hypothetical protein
MWMPEAATATCPPGVENPDGPIPPNIYPGLSGLPLPGNLSFCEWQVASFTPIFVFQYLNEIWNLGQVRACLPLSPIPPPPWPVHYASNNLLPPSRDSRERERERERERGILPSLVPSKIDAPKPDLCSPPSFHLASQADANAWLKANGWPSR